MTLADSCVAHEHRVTSRAQMSSLNSSCAALRVNQRPAGMHAHRSHKRVKGRSHTVEKRISMHPHKAYATSKPSWFSHTHRLSAPELVLTYLRIDIAGRGGRSGDALAVSTLRQHVSNLSMCFVRRGVAKPWDEVSGAGNPVMSQIVRDHVKVIERRQHASGQHARSATPVSISVVQRVLQHVDSSFTKAEANHNRLTRLRCVRDACVVALLWHSCRRGADLLRLTWGHIYAQGSGQLLSETWLAPSSAGLPSTILITADVLKNAKRHRPLTIFVHAQAGPSVAHSAIDRLRMLFDTKRALGEPVSGPMFCSYQTIQPPRPALTSHGFANRFQILLAAAFPDATSTPPTVHGVWHGRMPFEDAHGGTLQDILRLAGI